MNTSDRGLLQPTRDYPQRRLGRARACPACPEMQSVAACPVARSDRGCAVGSWPPGDRQGPLRGVVPVRPGTARDLSRLCPFSQTSGEEVRLIEEVLAKPALIASRHATRRDGSLVPRVIGMDGAPMSRRLKHMGAGSTAFGIHVRCALAGHHGRANPTGACAIIQHCRGRSPLSSPRRATPCARIQIPFQN
jgi:hypothetical protein